MEYFVYLPTYQLLVCRSCKTAVIGCRIKRHLQEEPHQLDADEIKEAQQWASTLRICQKAAEIIGIPVPPPDSLPIEALGEPKTGGFYSSIRARNASTSVSLVHPIG